MKILVIFTLCLISDGGAANEVTGYSGGGVLIKCKYKTKYTQNSKYFCKISQTSCSDQIKTDVKNQWVNSGRFSLFDDTRSAELWVMIRELTVQDTGAFYCEVNINWWENTLVKLNIKTDLSYEKSISETVHVGGDLTLSCKYPGSLRSYPKFLCETGLKDSICSYNVENREPVDFGNISLYDDRAKQIFNVSIRNVTEQDSGEYWCGAEVNWTFDHGYKVYFTKINLTVTQINLIDHPDFPSYRVITVSVVVVVLLLTGISVSLVVLCKRQAGKASNGKCSVQKSGTNQEYEENKDNRRRPAIFTVYSTAQRPIIRSEPFQTAYPNTEFPTSSCISTVYSTAQLPTTPSDQNIYSTAQLPIIPSDQNSYSTAQLPTNLSDCSDGAAQLSAEVSGEVVEFPHQL